MSWIVLLDGYNILLNWPQFKQDLEGHINLARDRLIRMSTNFADYQGHRVIMVFDAQRRGLRRAAHKKEAGVEIVYTKREQTADDYIIDWVRRYRGDEHVEVVTSDLELTDAVCRLGASVRTTFEFSDTYARVDETRRFSKPQEAIPDSDPRLGDRIDVNTRRQLEALKRKLKTR